MTYLSGLSSLSLKKHFVMVYILVWFYHINNPHLNHILMTVVLLVVGAPSDSRETAGQVACGRSDVGESQRSPLVAVHGSIRSIPGHIYTHQRQVSRIVIYNNRVIVSMFLHSIIRSVCR